MKSTIFDLLKSFGKNRGSQFISVRGYRNSEGEIANFVLNVRTKYETAKQKDIARLQALLKEGKFENDLQKQAAEELLESLIKPNENRSKGQTETYETIEGFPMLKRHIATGDLYIYGQCISKKVLVKGDYKPVNSRPLTIEKNKLRKQLRTSKLRLIKLGREENLKINGRVINLNE